MALRVAVTVAVFLVLLGAASGCKLAWNGNQACNKTNCRRLMGQVDQANRNLPGLAGMASSSPGGINYRFFPSLVLGDWLGSNATYSPFKFLDQIKADYVYDCCDECAKRAGCYMFRHFPIRADDIPASESKATQDALGGISPPQGGWPVVYPAPYPPMPKSVWPSRNVFTGYDPTGAKGNCVLFELISDWFYLANSTDAVKTPCTPGTKGCFRQPQYKNGVGSSFAVNSTTGLITNPTDVGVFNRPRSYWGGLCNGETEVVNDPHFLGGDGIRFDFNGEIGKSFCLISDSSLHVNMELGGYEDNRPAYAAKDGSKTIRSWITGLSFMWKDVDGTKHSLTIRARKGAEEQRGAGFISDLSLDGQQMRIPMQEGEVMTGNGVSLTLETVGKHGPYDVDTYRLQILDVFGGTLSLRVAHPMLRLPKEAYAHFNLKIQDFLPSDHVHGVLGQTFRKDASRRIRSLEYRLLSRLLHSQMHVDGPSGAGYLDGDVKDYVTSDVSSPDCTFAVWDRE